MKKTLLMVLAVLLVSLCFVSCLKQKEISVPQPATEKTETAVKTETTATQTTETQTTAQPEAKAKKYSDGTVLRMATGYNSANTGLFFDANTVKDGIDLNGTTYHAGDLKPTWVQAEKVLGVKFENKYQGNSATNEFKYWVDRLNEVDIVSGSASQLQEYGAAGAIVNLADYFDELPHFKAYLEENPIVRLSITGNTSTGAIYFSPYFDGANDIERMPLMRTDWVVKLLDGEGAFTAEKSGKTSAPVYTPYMPTTGKVAVDVVEKDGKTVKTINKDYDAAGNIIANMNKAGAMSGVEAVNMLRDYIDKAYNGYYGTQRSDLFVGQNAAWDADELVALMRCVVANAQTLNGTDTVYGMFSREDSNTQRRVDLFRFAGHLFGVRGLESRKEWLYFDSEGVLHDPRMEESTYKAMEKMNQMVQEGLISKSFVESSAETSSTMLENDLGLVSYDYNQTQTILNETKLQNADGEKYMAIMPPVAHWYDGSSSDGVFMRFTESWRSVKTDAWGISVAGVAENPEKLHAALALIDYAYTDEGMVLFSYGPDEFIKKNADGSYVTFNFNGKEMPVIADVTKELLWSLEKGNYTNFARRYLGSTLTFVKSQAFEFQCTHDIGLEGAGYISNAIAAGTIKHPELAVCENMWYTSIPTTLPFTAAQNSMIKTYTDLSATLWSTSKGGVDVLLDLIVGSYPAVPQLGSNAAEAAKTVASTFSGELNLALHQSAWAKLLTYYYKNN